MVIAEKCRWYKLKRKIFDFLRFFNAFFDDLRAVAGYTEIKIKNIPASGKQTNCLSTGERLASPKPKKRSIKMKQQRTLIISVVGLVLVTLTACVQVSPPGATGAVPESVTVAENEVQSGSTYLAANPELMAARRHNGVVKNEAVNGSTFYAANPELMVAGQYTATGEDEGVSSSAFFAENPELMVAGRHVIVVDDKTLTSSGRYAANPELMVAERYTAPIIEPKETSGSKFFAANPEMMAVHRYAAAATEK
jgi:hypothetical protein